MTFIPNCAAVASSCELNKTVVIEVPIGETLSPFIFGIGTAD